MKAILINPNDQTIIAVEVDKKDKLRSWYKLMNVDRVEVAQTLPNRDVLLVDEEGLFKHTPWFRFKGQPLTGYGLIARMGDTDIKSTIDEIKAVVKWGY